MAHKDTAWWKTMISIHGSEEAVRNQMRVWGQQHDRRDYSSNYLKQMATEDPETLKIIQRDRAKRKRNR